MISKHKFLKVLIRYQIKVTIYDPDFKKEVQKLIDDHQIKAIILGNRRTDPWSRDLE